MGVSLYLLFIVLYRYGRVNAFWLPVAVTSRNTFGKFVTARYD
jgi:hypothetical protein